VTLEEARDVFRALVDEGVDFVVIGAMAMAAQGLPLATQDLDFFLAPTRENVEALKRALAGLFNDPSVDEISADDLLGDYPAVEYVPPHGRFWIDIRRRARHEFEQVCRIWTTADRLPIGRANRARGHRPTA